jgi:hypothetical protein
MTLEFIPYFLGFNRGLKVTHYQVGCLNLTLIFTGTLVRYLFSLICMIFSLIGRIFSLIGRIFSLIGMICRIFSLICMTFMIKKAD